jgi:hypothetical protein
MNRIELFNEYSISVCSIHMLYFTEWVHTPEDKYFYGWIMCAIIIINVLVNLCFVLYFGVSGILKLYKRVRRRYRNATRPKYFDSYDKYAEHIEELGIKVTNRIPVKPKPFFTLTSNTVNNAKINSDSQVFQTPRFNTKTPRDRFEEIK